MQRLSTFSETLNDHTLGGLVIFVVFGMFKLVHSSTFLTSR